MRIGKQIQEIRKSQGLNQRELAARIGTNQPQIVRWEAADSLTYASLQRIAAGLGVAVEDLLQAIPRKTKPAGCALCGNREARLYNLGRQLHKTVFCLACILAEPEACLDVRDGRVKP